MRRRNDTPALNKIGFRVTNEEWNQILKKALLSGQNMAEYCRSKALGKKALTSSGSK